MRYFLLVITCTCNILFAKSGHIIHKNIAYLPISDNNFDTKKSRLDIYVPKEKGDGREIIVFIHGGNWDSGKKELYRFFGKRMADKGKIAVIINYRLSPDVDYFPMAMDCASAIKWVHDHIAAYGGDRNKIVVSGHSAGGHLAALISNDNQYFDSLKIVNPIKGCVLLDAFGLDMFSYFPTSRYKHDEKYKIVFGQDPVTWKKASPVFYLNASSPPHLLLLGGNTFPGIKRQMHNYANTLQQKGIKNSFYIVPKRSHVGMILQFYWKKNENFQRIFDFMTSCCQ